VEAYLPYFFMAAGLFSVAGGIFGWEWFLNNRKARLWVKLFGRGGARVFYVVLGLVIAGLGVGIATDSLPEKASEAPADGEAEVR
jgi:hypothetical protein